MRFVHPLLTACLASTRDRRGPGTSTSNDRFAIMRKLFIGASVGPTQWSGAISAIIRLR